MNICYAAHSHAQPIFILSEKNSGNQKLTGEIFYDSVS